MIEIKHLKFKSILDIEHLVIDRDISCIVGSSGCGKTTLMRMLNRLNDPDEGEILFDGKNIMEINPVALRRSIVMLGQTPIMYHGTIEDNLQVGLRLSKRLPASKERMMEYLRKVQLEKHLEDGVEKLSGGEKQRLCLARVMLMDADVYLLDEPSSALDKETEGFVIENMVNFTKEQQKMLIMVTHSEEIAQRYPNSILRMEAGHCRGYEYE